MEIPPREEWPAWVQKQIDAVVKERVNAKNSEIEALKAELGTARAKAADFDKVSKELTDLREAGSREAAFRGVGLGLDGVTDETERARIEAIRTGVQTFLTSHNVGLETPLSLDQYLAGPAREHPLIAHALPSPERPQPGGGTPAGSPGGGSAPRAPATPATPAGAHQPPRPTPPDPKATDARVQQLLKEGKRDEARQALRDSYNAS